MLRRSYSLSSLFALLFILAAAAYGQPKQEKTPATGTPVMWAPVAVAEKNLFTGPGGEENAPDLSAVTFVSEETGGFSKKIPH